MTLTERAAALIARYAAAKLMIATAESCTGGLVAAHLTEISGSSTVVDCGFITYSNAAKMRLLGVPEHLLAEHGAVSEEVARAMAEGALAHSAADVAVSITGIAGPTGGSDLKPVGLVHFGLARRGQPTHALKCQFGAMGRENIRTSSVIQAFKMLESALNS